MDKLTLKDVETIVDIMAAVAIENEKEFSRLDGICGDGDFGTSLAEGFGAISEKWDTYDRSSFKSFLMQCGMTITSNTGGCSGPLWGTSFLKAGLTANEQDSLSLHDLVTISRVASEAMMARGGAKLGDKTLLDALDAATQAIQKAANESKPIPVAFQSAAEASAAKTEEAKSWTALRGRQSFTGERSQDTYDPGMVAITKMLEAVAAHFSK